MSGDFGEAMGKVGSFVGGAAIGVATGGVALAGRRVLGAAGARLASNESLKTSRLGRNLVSAGRVMESSTYDLKNTKVAQFGLKKAGFNPNEYVNTTVKTGYKDVKSGQIKARKEYLDSMKLSENSKEVSSLNEKKEASDKAKENYNDSYKKWKEYSDISRKRALTAQEATDFALAETEMTDKRDKMKTAASDSKAAKEEVEKTNAKIIGGIVKNIDTSQERLDAASADRKNAHKNDWTAGLSQAATYVGVSAKQAKDIITGSVSGRQASVADFRNQYKKAYNASGQNKPPAPTPANPNPTAPTPNYPFPKTPPTTINPTPQAPAPATPQPAVPPTVTQPTYTQTTTTTPQPAPTPTPPTPTTPPTP